MAPPTFISTERLDIRGFDPSDSAFWLRCKGKYAVYHPGTLGYVVPPLVNQWEQDKTFLEGALFAGVVEVKRAFAHLRRPSPEEDEEDPEPAKDSAEHRAWEKKRRLAGVVILSGPRGKNRDLDLGIMFDPPWQGLGIGTEVLQWLIPYAFDQLGLHRISLSTKESNIPARRLYEKVGFTEEGRKRSAIWEDGRWVDLIDFAVVEGDPATKSNVASKVAGKKQ